MAKFTTRVELHGAGDDDYETLHTAMESRGFSRTIASADGTVYKLPTAEYSYNGESTVAEVREMAKAAAQTTGKRFAILVSESIVRSWYLDQA
jgi:hypothetical protein